MLIQSPVYKFASLRNPNSEFPANGIEYVTFDTKIFDDLSSIVDSTETQEDKLKSYNEVLQVYINSNDFIRTKKEFAIFFKGDTSSEEKIKKLYSKGCFNRAIN